MENKEKSDFFALNNCVYKSEQLNIDNLNIPLVISYENNLTNNSNSQFFKQTLEKNNWEYMFIGENRQWNGFFYRMKSYYEILLQLPSDKIIILSDARDVLCIKSSLTYIKDVKEILEQNKIIVSAEMFLIGHMEWTEEDIQKCLNKNPNHFWQGKPLNDYWKHYNITNKPFRKYVNGGLITAKASQLIKFFKWSIDNNYNDDQLALAEYTNTFPECISLDYNANILHTSTACVSGGLYDINIQKNDSPTFSQLLGLTNYFLHIPGAAISKGQICLYDKVCYVYNTINQNMFSLYSVKPNDKHDYIEKVNR